MNMMSDTAYSRKLWFCDECESQIDSLSHIAVCPAYQPLRAGKDINCDKDLAEYVYDWGDENKIKIKSE